jgi:peptide deformylase
MILELTPNTHPILHERVKPCSKDLDRQKMSRILRENMIHYGGVGLSANQIGIGERVFIMVLNMETEETITCFNPRIIKRYDELVNCEEGCLSFPDEFISVDRPDKIVVKYEDEDKKEHKIKLSGMAARVFLHEFDHLEGIVFTERQ